MRGKKNAHVCFLLSSALNITSWQVLSLFEGGFARRFHHVSTVRQMVGSGRMLTALALGVREQSTRHQRREGCKDFGTHTGCSFQIFTSSAVRPASRMSRLTRDTLPALDYRQITVHITDEAKGKSTTCSSLFLAAAKIGRVELLALIRVTWKRNTYLAPGPAIKYCNYLLESEISL